MHIQPNWHEIWLWLWYFVGAFFYWLKRAYYGINPPNPVATGYLHYVKRAGVPLLVRFFADSVVFWMLFTPGFADQAAASLGLAKVAWVIAMCAQLAPFATSFGFAIDGAMDIGISKLPWFKDVLPQMPGPLPNPQVRGE